MMRPAGDRANDYRAKLDAEPDDGPRVRRVARVTVPRPHGRGAFRAAQRRADARAIFEEELAEAVEDYADMRADAADTTELADYIAYLADVVAALTDGEGRAREARSERRERAWEAIAASAARRKHRTT